MDENNNNNKDSDSEELKRAYQREQTITKLTAVRAVKKLSNKDSPWTLTQEIFQEVIAGYTVKDPDSIPKTPDLIKDLNKEICARYKDDEEMRDLLLASIPAAKSVREWVKLEGWNEAVWNKIRGEGLFTPSKRAEVIESLRKRALDKSDVAAKIWLTLSGDYSEKMEVDNKTADTYREINKILHSKKDN